MCGQKLRRGTQKMLIWNNSQAKLRTDGCGEAVPLLIGGFREVENCDVVAGGEKLMRRLQKK